MFPLMPSCLSPFFNLQWIQTLGDGAKRSDPPSTFFPYSSQTLNLCCTCRSYTGTKTSPFSYVGPRNTPWFEEKNTVRTLERRRNRGEHRGSQRHCDVLDIPGGSRTLGWFSHETFNICGSPFWPAAGPDVLPPAGLGPVCQQQQGQR